MSKVDDYIALCAEWDKVNDELGPVDIEIELGYRLDRLWMEMSAEERGQARQRQKVTQP